MRGRLPSVLPGVLIAAAAGPQAQAHLVSTQLGPFYDGAAHALVSPEDLLSILVVAILAGLGGPGHGRRALAAIAGGWLLGAMAGFGLSTGDVQAPLITAATLLVLGIAAAMNLRLTPGVVGAAGAVVGVCRGVLGGGAAWAAGGTMVAVAGMAAGAFILSALLMAGGVWLAEHRAGIALRVGGSWLAAIGLLMVGWRLHTAG